MPSEMIHSIANLLGPSDFAALARTSRSFHQKLSSPHLIPIIVRNGKAAARQTLLDGFVTVPGGLLPTGVYVDSFEAASYPVTRNLWNGIMGRIPLGVPPHLRDQWNQCPNCPVTYVATDYGEGFIPGIQKFIRRVNLLMADSGCEYSLPTEYQLKYMIRGDQTGKNKDPYSMGVTDENVREFIHFCDPKAKAKCKLQPVGQKLPNAFKIELGNVSRLFMESADMEFQVFSLGGSWKRTLIDCRSRSTLFHHHEEGNDEMGFSLIRNCIPEE